MVDVYPTGGKGGTTTAGIGGGKGEYSYMSFNGSTTSTESKPGGNAYLYNGGLGAMYTGQSVSKNTYIYYGGGGGGSGFRGGGGGANALTGYSWGYRNDTTSTGGGGGSSAIRTSSFPGGIVSVVIKSIESNQCNSTETPANGTQIVF